MPVLGIIAEYNPLHCGHAYHIKKAKEITDADTCIIVLSSNFVQRGEPAIISKQARTKMALLNGADLVLELPSAFSCASAEYFAAASVKILNSLSCVDYLCFGSEDGSLHNLEKTADLLAFESSELKASLKSFLDKGLSFAAARQNAILTVDDSNQEGSPNNSQDIHHITKPNNILGIEYIKALKRLGSSIKPVTTPRIGQGYNSTEAADSYSSATAIRKHISDSELHSKFARTDFLKNNIPQSSLDTLEEEFSQGLAPVYPKNYEKTLLHLLRNMSSEELATLPYMGEGLENRLKKAAINAVSFDEIVLKTVTSRYPASRIKRILISLLTCMTSEFLQELKLNGYAQYIRVLGLNEKGRQLLSRIKKKALLPILTKPADYRRKLNNNLAQRLFEHEIRATDAYVLGFPDSKKSLGATEFTMPLIYIK